MMRYITLVFILVFSVTNTFAQKERKMVRDGFKEYQNDQFSEAEVNFRKALDAKPDLFEADYNIANSLYKQKKYEESATEYDKLIQENVDPAKRADLYHNLGNSHIMNQQFDKGIDAYKNALRIRPDDEDTRYNLAYAMQMMKQQQEQNQQQQEQNQQEQNQEEDKKQEQQQEQQDGKEEEQKTSDQQLSKEEAEQMLNAIQNLEKEVKEKLDKKKAVARPIPTEKDW
jgi:tetratricopeptide (TPR) repeat protein